MTEQELKHLLQSMSLEEKVGQMVQVTGAFLEEDAVITGPAADAGLELSDCKLAGSILGIAGAKRLRKIQERYMEEHPHHIPLLMMADVIHGYCTVFPIPLALGASFHPELVEKAMTMAAAEAASAGLHVTFSPMTDLVRDPRWGRVLESFGESPWLDARMAEAYVRGYQGPDNDLSRPGRLSACDKHFVGYGAPVAGREYNHAELSEHTLREFHLPAKIAAIRAGTACVMPAFQSLNGVPCTASEKIVRNLLRDELGFEGVTISDWSAVGELVAQGAAENTREAAKLAIEAGIDIDMMSVCYARELKGLVESGEVEERLVDEAVWRILTLKNRLGLFEDPFHGAGVQEEKRTVLCEKHRDLARSLVAESVILLKNKDAVLPLDSGSRTAFIGPYVDSTDTCGSWAIFQNREDTVTLRRGVTEGGYGANAVFCHGCDVLENTRVLGFGVEEVFGQSENRDEWIREALQAAKEADRVVMALGEHTLQSGEAASRGDITIPHQQMELLRQISAVNPNVVTVVYSGRPLDLREVSACSKAVLAVFLPGTMGGAGIADVLFGQTSPGGRVSMSFPWSVAQVPVYHDDYTTGRPYDPAGAEQKFVSRYLDMPNEPLYPFGYGLTYGSFRYSPVRLSAGSMGQGQILTASVTVKNEGSMAAKETVQLYLRDEKGTTVRPRRELKGAKCLYLQPGEEGEAVFEITEDLLKIWDKNMNFLAEPGWFTIYVGGDSRTENSARFRYEG